MNTVFPLSLGVFDLAKFRSLMRTATQIDLSSVAKQPAEQVVVLGKLFHHQLAGDEFKLLTAATEVYKHFPFGFIVVANTERKNLWLEHVDVELSVFTTELDDGFVILATGSLREWKRVLVENLKPSRSTVLRDQLKQVLTAFDNFELTACFHDYRRQYDDSLYLEKK